MRTSRARDTWFVGLAATGMGVGAAVLISCGSGAAGSAHVDAAGPSGSPIEGGSDASGDGATLVSGVASGAPSETASVADEGSEEGASDPAETMPAQPDGPSVTSIGYVSWIWPEPKTEGHYLGYVRVGNAVPLKQEEKVAGPGCPNGFYAIEPRGYLCDDRTVTRDPEATFAAAAAASRGSSAALPYRYAISNGAPMYNRIPTPAEQQRFESYLGPAGEHAELPMFSRSHEELAVDTVIEPTHPVPAFYAEGRSPKTPPFDLVEQTIPLGSMLSFTHAFEAEGRTWLLSADHTLVPADRVRLFRPTTFEGTELGGGVALPIAWMRVEPRPRYSVDGERVTQHGHFAVRTFAGLTGAELEVDGRTYLETTTKLSDGTPAYVDADDATVVEPETEIPVGVQPGQKWFMIRIEAGTLVAYEGLEPVFATLISPGAGGVSVKGQDNVKYSTTPRGTYYITFKEKAATMSPEKGKNRSFWIQDVPYTQYFYPPFALHGAYWHERFGEYVSAGCVNLSPVDAKRLFAWSDPPVPDFWQGASGAGATRFNGPTTAVVVRR